jgi:predicted DCC family thiol-disulfide oxidoreductase YuxK
MPSQPLILFDGVCNLCAGSVQFVLKRDPGKTFRFASLQGEASRTLLRELGQSPELLSSVVLFENGKIFTRSTAALRIVKRLSGIWPLLYMFIIVPPFIRDAVYQVIALNRYRWFGKKNECWIPDPQWKERFLD